MDRDNQQGRSHFYIGYILGLIDGEGCYQLENDGKGHFYPSLVISNTNDEIIKMAQSYLRTLGISCWVWSPKLSGKEKRPYQRLYIKGIKRMKKFLDIFTEYPHAKSYQANLLKEYCKLRLSIPIKELYSNGKHDYTKELEIKSKLKTLNAKYKGAFPSETIRFNTLSV